MKGRKDGQKEEGKSTEETGKTREAFGESQGRAVGVPRGDPALRFISFRTHGRPARTASLGSQAW